MACYALEVDVLSHSLHFLMYKIVVQVEAAAHAH